MSLIKQLAEFKNYRGKNVYIVSADNIFVAATTKKEVNGELKKLGPDRMDAIVFALDEADTVILYGLVLNHKELPYEIPKEFKSMHLYLLIEEAPNSVYCMQCQDINELTGEIEYLVDDGYDIDDFVVVLGKSIRPVLQIATSTAFINPEKIYV